ncbi:MAG: rRNA pseudouridine synthase [Clostridia bacterium]|nr:rRNA pseudouridine synthase [Clostridia bacterium]
MEELRIQKYLADCGICSRRAAERSIEEGDVKINGILAEIGQKIRPDRDKVTYRGRPVVKKRNAHPCYVMLHKPAGYVTTMSDEKGRKTVAELVAGVDQRVYPVGRLDMDSEGLLLFTSDGELANALTHPRHHIPKIYHVRVEGQVSRAQLTRLGEPMEIDGYKIQPVECAIVKQDESATTIEMILYEGRNRQIRKMCEQVDLTVRRLRRIAIGELELDIPRGKWRYLNKDEADYLKESAGLIKKER